MFCLGVLMLLTTMAGKGKAVIDNNVESKVS